VVVRAALKWAPTDMLSITPSIYYQELRLGTPRLMAAAVQRRRLEFENGNAQRKSQHRSVSLTAVKVEWDAGFAHLTSNTSYFSRNQHSTSDYTAVRSSIVRLNDACRRPASGTSYDATCSITSTRN